MAHGIGKLKFYINEEPVVYEGQFSHGFIKGIGRITNLPQKGYFNIEFKQEKSLESLSLVSSATMLTAGESPTTDRANPINEPLTNEEDVETRSRRNLAGSFEVRNRKLTISDGLYINHLSTMLGGQLKYFVIANGTIAEMEGPTGFTIYLPGTLEEGKKNYTTVVPLITSINNQIRDYNFRTD